MRRRSFLFAVTGLALGAPSAAQVPRRRAYGCSDRDRSDPARAHGTDKDSGPRADPVLRFLYQDGSDTGAVSDAGSHARNRPQIFCPAKGSGRAR